jgi:hypothetical protein
MGRKPKSTNDLQSLADTAQDQLRRAEKLGKSLDIRLKTRQSIAPDWVPDEDWRRDFATVTATIQHAGNSLIRAREGNKKNLGSATEEQLEAQFAAEIVAAAAKLTDEEWAIMVEARAKAKQGR